jgi:hypothetical protein
LIPPIETAPINFDPFALAARMFGWSRSRNRRAEVARSMDENPKGPIDARPLNRPAVLGLLSSTGPEAPPEPQKPAFADEPTQQVPVVAARTPAFPRFPAATQTPVGTPGVAPKPEPPKVEARAVIVYQPEPRRSWGLWVLTAVLVSLTVGVVLGQTVADVPRTGSAAAQVQPTEAGYSTPPTATPSPSNQAPGLGQGLPVTGQRVSAALGKLRAQQLEISGGATLVTVRSVDLGDRLFDIAALDDSAVPQVVTLRAGPRLEFVRTGAPGRVGAVIQLNSKVKWKLRLVGGAAEQDIDMRAGGFAGLDLIGGASRTVLQLPVPKGTVPLTVSGVVSELNVQAGKAVPVRVKLTRGADNTVVDGKTRKSVKAGTTLTSTGWTTTTNRYDVTATAKLGTLHVDHL